MRAWGCASRASGGALCRVVDGSRCVSRACWLSVIEVLDCLICINEEHYIQLYRSTVISIYYHHQSYQCFNEKIILNFSLWEIRVLTQISNFFDFLIFGRGFCGAQIFLEPLFIKSMCADRRLRRQMECLWQKSGSRSPNLSQTSTLKYNNWRWRRGLRRRSVRSRTAGSVSSDSDRRNDRCSLFNAPRSTLSVRSKTANF